MSNPFNLLGNDVEDVNDTYIPRENVRKSTSSKKADVPPPSANKDRANKNRPQPTGNEAAIRDRSAGRAANKAKGVEEPKQQKKSSKPKDRQSRTGKTDSSKKIKQAGWTADGETELEAETEAAHDAEEELKADAEPKQAKKSFADYLKEQEEQNSMEANRATRTVAAVDNADIIVKEEEDFIAASKTKNLKNKQLKTKNYLDFDATFADELPRPSSGRGPRGNFRGGARGARGSSRGARGNNLRGASRGGKVPAKGPKMDEENFPSL